MVRRDLVARKLSRARSWLDDADAILIRPPGEARSQERDVAAFYLMLAIQECIDIAAHWVADEGWGSPDDAANTFDVLAERRVIQPALADALHGAVGLRNRIAHGYAQLDHDRIRTEAAAGIARLREFLKVTSDALSL
jgi:uncharacterized protein YutE (UPF0331/DUF86 family)